MSANLGWSCAHFLHVLGEPLFSTLKMRDANTRKHVNNTLMCIIYLSTNRRRIAACTYAINSDSE